MVEIGHNTIISVLPADIDIERKQKYIEKSASVFLI